MGDRLNNNTPITMSVAHAKRGAIAAALALGSLLLVMVVLDEHPAAEMKEAANPNCGKNPFLCTYYHEDDSQVAEKAAKVDEVNGMTPAGMEKSEKEDSQTVVKSAQEVSKDVGSELKSEKDEKAREKKEEKEEAESLREVFDVQFRKMMQAKRERAAEKKAKAVIAAKLKRLRHTQRIKALEKIDCKHLKAIFDNSAS